jgi:hypothetical protein
MTDSIEVPSITHFSAVPDEEHDGIVLVLRSDSGHGEQESKIFFHREQALECVTLWMQAIHELQKKDGNVRAQH